MESFGADDHTPNTQTEMNYGTKDNYGVEPGQSRYKLKFVFLRNPVAVGITNFDPRLYHPGQPVKGGRAAATFEEGEQAAEYR